MEFMPNGNLHEYVEARSGKLSWDQRLALCSDVICGLAYLHGRNVVHRDLKVCERVSNVLPTLCISTDFPVNLHYSFD